MDDTMRAGLQIFTFSGNYAALDNDPHAVRLEQSKNDAELIPILAGLVKSGKIIWENQARGINPNSRLAEMMGIKLQRQPRRQPGL